MVYSNHKRCYVIRRGGVGRPVGIGGGHGGPCPPPIICTNMPPPQKKINKKNGLSF